MILKEVRMVKGSKERPEDLRGVSQGNGAAEGKARERLGNQERTLEKKFQDSIR